MGTWRHWENAKVLQSSMTVRISKWQSQSIILEFLANVQGQNPTHEIPYPCWGTTVTEIVLDVALTCCCWPPFETMVPEIMQYLWVVPNLSALYWCSAFWLCPGMSFWNSKIRLMKTTAKTPIASVQNHSLASTSLYPPPSSRNSQERQRHSILLPFKCMDGVWQVGKTSMRRKENTSFSVA